MALVFLQPQIHAMDTNSPSLRSRIKENDTKVIRKIIISKPGLLKARNVHGSMPLHLAIWYNKPEWGIRDTTPKIIELLVLMLMKKNKTDQTPLMLAQAANKPLNVLALKKCGATE